jgi:LPXTG-site transpeptidase (sortase) family protein
MVSTSASSDWIVAQRIIYDQKRERQKKRVWNPVVWKLILYGIPLVLLWGVLGVFVPVIVEEVKFQYRSTKENVSHLFPQGMVPQLSFAVLPEWVGDYSVEIPKIGVREQVVESVDAANEDLYTEALKRGIAHARGTTLPGLGGVQYYFAHSSGLPFWGDRAVVFALLHKLDAGDNIFIYREGRKHTYIVESKHIVSPEDISWLISQDTSEQVVLQTCWPLGTNWKRLLVVAKPISG